MQFLTLSDLQLALANLLEERRPALNRSAAGKLYAPMLESKLEQINALPPAFIGGKAFASELAMKDTEHDGIGSAVFSMTEAYLRHPKASAAVKKAATTIREVFIPSLAALNVTYSDEASAAAARKKLLKKHKASLDLIPVAEGGTLFNWVSDFVAAGEAVGALLNARADLPAASRDEAGALRASTIGMLGRLRAAITDELAHHSKLPRDLDAKVFSYVDELHGPRELAARAKKKAATKRPEAPANT